MVISGPETGKLSFRWSSSEFGKAVGTLFRSSLANGAASEGSAGRGWPGFAAGRAPRRGFNNYGSNFFASAATSSFVVFTSLIATVVVRSTSRSLPLKLTVPWTWY